MEIYFYCSYEHSRTGFFLTRFENEQLVAADFSSLPPVVEEFFSYDRFRLLWRDLCYALEKPLDPPEITGSFCGIREMKGIMRDGRNGTVNMAIYADAHELTLMRRVVLSILGDFDTFRGTLFQWLSAGGDCSYQLDGTAFRRWLEECGSRTHLRPVSKQSAAASLLPSLQRNTAPRWERDLLRLAVCIRSWKELCETMGSRLMWGLKPRCVLMEQEFTKAFSGHGPVWTME